MNSVIYAQDPILLEKVEINTWLSESPDNIIILIDLNDNTHIRGISLFESTKQNILAVTKNYIQNVNIRDIFLKCALVKEQFLHRATSISKSEFYNLGFYLNRNILINLDEVEPSKLTGQFFNLILSNNKEKYINKEYLKLSSIGIAKPITIKLKDNLSIKEKELVEIENNINFEIFEDNLPCADDIYFEDILNVALFDYSHHWDSAINIFLRKGSEYFDTEVFKKYQNRFGDTKEEAKQAIIDKIADLDRVFIEAAPRNENTNTPFWRGMKEEITGQKIFCKYIKFSSLNNIGDKIVVSNFLSMTRTYSVAEQFSGIKTKSGCCIYKLLLDKGIPYIDMVNTSKFKDEDEILLPRGLILELIEIIKTKTPTAEYPEHTSTTFVVRAGLSKANVKEFKIKTGCREFVQATLVKLPKNDPFFEIYNKNVKTKSNSVKEKK
jgi:hypothetical protein